MSSGVWSSESLATIRIPLDEGVYTCTLKIAGPNLEEKEQIISIACSGTFVSSVALDETGKSADVTFLLMIDPPNPTRGALLSLESSTLTSLDLGDDEGTRPVGLHLISLDIRPLYLSEGMIPI